MHHAVSMNERKANGDQDMKGGGVEENAWHKNVRKSLREEVGGITLLLFQNACSLFWNGTQVNLNWGDVYAGMR